MATHAVTEPLKIASLYTLFAVVAIAVNIGAQDVTNRFYGGRYHLFASILVGTGVGLVAKYALDKRYIFNHTTESLSDEARTFYLYALMGIATTGIFWSLEFLFDWAFDSLFMRYLGGILGLAIGYYVKYQLDKRFVFQD